MANRAIKGLVSAAALCAALGLPLGHAQAEEGPCPLVARGQTLSLLADCQTDHTLIVPDGYALDGRGHTLRAVDPIGGSFEGAVVQSGGSEAHVRNLRIVATGLLAQCHPGAPVDTRLRGILFKDSSGSISNNRIAINQGSSGCQEGAGIEVRTTGTGSRKEVLISGNRVEDFQKTGIFVQGPIDAHVYLNRVSGEGPVDFIAQNGIHLTGNVAGHVKLNHVSGTLYTPGEVSATGILVVDNAEPLELSLNQVDDADVALRLTRVSGAEVTGNALRFATYDGISLDGRTGAAEHNRVVGNHIQDTGVGINLFGAGVQENLITLNRIADSGIVAIQVTLGATNNRIVCNHVEPEVEVAPGSGELSSAMDRILRPDFD